VSCQLIDLDIKSKGKDACSSRVQQVKELIISNLQVDRVGTSVSKLDIPICCRDACKTKLFIHRIAPAAQLCGTDGNV